jgi:hypothetical protein
MKLFNIILFSFFSLFCFIVTNAGTIDPSIPDSKYVEFGKKFYCIHKICGTYTDGSKFCASAVVIDKNHILTAAHVVKGYKNCYITIDDNKFNLSQIIIHKDFESGGFGIADIAIGYSAEEFGMEYYPAMYTENDEVGKVCSISGYGLTGNFNSGTNKFDGIKRAGSNTIDTITKDLLICTPSKRGDKDHTPLEFIIGSGDSGGGLFIDGKLAGINSCIMVEGRSPSSKYGEESGYTRISKFLEWINESKKKMAESSKRQ